MAEVSKVTGPQLRSPLTARAKNPPERTAKPSLNILPISVWSLSAQSVELPSGAAEGEDSKHLGRDRDEDSLLANVELDAGALSSIL